MSVRELEDGNIFELDTVSGKTVKLQFFKKFQGVLCRDGVRVEDVLDAVAERLKFLGETEAVTAVANVRASLGAIEAHAHLDDRRIPKSDPPKTKEPTKSKSKSKSKAKAKGGE